MVVDEWSLALHEAYRRMSVTTGAVYETAANLFALMDALVDKSVISVEELDQYRRQVELRLNESYDQAQLSVEIGDDVDKYALASTVAIDCESRFPLCRAACCRLRVALGEQDIHEGIVEWELTRPYLNRQRADGYCVHSNGDTGSCTVYPHRPATCRTYDCRNDTRIWLDFEQRVINPDILVDPSQTSGWVPVVLGGARSAG